MLDDDREGQDELRDAGRDAGGGSSAVAFEVEMVFEGVVDRLLDPDIKKRNHIRQLEASATPSPLPLRREPCTWSPSIFG